MNVMDKPTRYLFFTGKGGVGKTSLACATAIGLADGGKQVLLVSTDPASNLDEVLGVRLGSRPTPVPLVERLLALNVDPEAAAREYRERMVGPYRGVLPAAAVASVEEQLSGACTTEIAAFDEFAKLLGDPAATVDFDYVLFDTAPTGHTLRLLTLPSAWNGFLESNTGGTSCLGPLAGLQAQRDLYAATVKALSDAGTTTVVLVSRPERSALAEAERTRAELAALGVANQHVIINGVFKAYSNEDVVATAMERRGQSALAQMPTGLASLKRIEVSLQPFNLVGIASLRAFEDPAAFQETEEVSGSNGPLPPSLAELIPDLVRQGHGVIMTMGKGGVGKTTIASAIAVELASRGHRVHLSTTDPAAHVDASLAQTVPNLRVSRIGPAAETEIYRAEVMAAAAPGLDEQGRKLLEEDLRSPCTEEVAVFRAFARTVDEGKDGFVVLDTAPTGHTLLLLDATEAYHRQVSHTMSDLPEAVRQILPRLRDPQFTRILIVTLAEATPVHEAAQLQKDLARAAIKPYAWVINQAFVPLELTDPVLAARRQQQHRYVSEVADKHADIVAVVPWMADEPVGAEALRRLMHGQSDRGRFRENGRHVRG